MGVIDISQIHKMSDKELRIYLASGIKGNVYKAALREHLRRAHK